MMDDLARWDVSAYWEQAAAPLLSILIPTYDHNVVPLCVELLHDMATLAEGQVEILVLIDGNPALSGQQRFIAEANRLHQPAALALASANLGRSMARNRLAQLARGKFLHFLDADSLPDSPGFIGRTLKDLRTASLSGTAQPVLCGGRTGKRMAAAERDAQLFELHCQKREWISAAERNKDPAASFLSANFVVSRALFSQVPFDESFRGWGWEDTEWALRASAQAPIYHVENTVSHMEHHTDAAWLARIERAAVNYALLFQYHPDAVRRHRIFPLIRLLSPLHGLPPLALLLRKLTLWTVLPTSLRLVTLKLFQALTYGKAFHLSIAKKL